MVECIKEKGENMGQYKPAVFLDRDGVLTREKSYITNIADLEIFPYAKQCIHDIKQKGYWTIVITNQSAVARGMLSEKMLCRMNDYLQQETGVDAIYYCPHHPDAAVNAYRKQCDCRKPGMGMFQQAMKEFLIDKEGSYMIGDRAADILAGKNMGLTTILLESGYGTKRLEFDVKPDYVLEDLCKVCDLL